MQAVAQLPTAAWPGSEQSCSTSGSSMDKQFMEPGSAASSTAARQHNTHTHKRAQLPTAHSQAALVPPAH